MLRTIYLLYYTIPSTQHKSQSYRYMFRLNKSSSGLSKDHNYRIFRQIMRALSTQKRSKFVKNEHARYTLGMKKGKNLERLITATSQARF